MVPMRCACIVLDVKCHFNFQVSAVHVANVTCVGLAKIVYSVPYITVWSLFC